MHVEVVLMVGISGSGKSTFAKQNFPNHVHMSLDDIRTWDSVYRQEILDRHSSPSIDSPRMERKIEKILITEALEDGKDVVVDDTNLTRKIRHEHVSRGWLYGAKVNVVFFDNAERAHEQNKNRPKPLDEGVLYTQHKFLERPSRSEGFGYVKVVK